MSVKILIADDDRLTLRLLRKTLEQEDYEVIAVENGSLALEYMCGAAGPRLALVDWLMPGMNGLEVCREVRRRSEHPYVYIILLTARTSKQEIVQGLQAGADDYLTKPWDSEELKARLRAGARVLKLEDKLAHDAFHDSLTQLPNRAFFLERLTFCVKWGARRPDYKFAVLSVDMDRFRVVNDSLGNAAGDWLLVQVADRLQQSIRYDDAMLRSAEDGGMTGQQEQAGVLARLGGDKFTILLDHIRDATEAIRVADRIQRNIQEPFLVADQVVHATASIGIAFSGTGYSAAEYMLGDANTAMTRAKSLGKARYEMCDPRMHDVATGRFKLETDLRSATERREFRLHYQPIISLGDLRVTGFEALVRWQRPNFGMVMPAGFISAAEDTGLILSIGYWVLQEACRQLAAWIQQFPAASTVTIAVNISAKQFDQSNLVGQIEQVLRESGLAADNLKLELTESVTMRDETRTTRILSELRALGVSLCIDDFGTGYSSLSYLRRFPLDVLKIDRSFVADMLSNSESQEIIKTIVSLGNNLDMDVVAEGVENSEQVRLLQGLGCRFAQGYFFSKPVDAAAAAIILATSEVYRHLSPQEAPPTDVAIPTNKAERRPCEVGHAARKPS